MKRMIIFSFSLLLSIASSYGSEDSIMMDDGAKFIAGMRYFSGNDGVPQDFDKAKDYLQPLAEQGHSMAQYFYATILFGGSDVAKNAELAFHYYTLAQKSPDLPENMVHALEYCIAQMYFTGEGVTKDENTALQLLINSGEGGNKSALIDLGQLYLHGNDFVQKNLTQAGYWLEKAGLSGDALSSFTVGQMYCNGDLDQDTSKAIQWFERARYQVFHLATHNLACIYIKNGKYQDAVKAYAYFKEAANHNVPQSLYMVGLMYSTGEGVDGKDIDRALSYFKRAEALGFSQATVEIKKIEKTIAAPLNIDFEFKGIYLCENLH